MADIKVGTRSGLRQGLTGVECDGEKLLLVRDGEAIRAFEGLCPHAQAPLQDGALCDGRIICPWHMAHFDAASGALLEPVAMRGLKSYPVRITGDAIFVGLEPTAAKLAPPPSGAPVFALVGAGAAAATAAVTLRDAGFAGRMIMIGPDAAEPLDRTLLSKMALAEADFDRGMLPLIDASDLALERKLASVTALDAAQRRLTLSTGEVIAYDAALLATGATPVPLEVPGAELGHVHKLRSLGDLDRILAQARAEMRVVVIGTSFIGMEAASALQTRGLAVTVVGEESLPFAKQFGDRVAAALRALHESKGVTFRLAAKVDRITAGFVALDSGEQLPADLVITGIGVRPTLDFAGSLNRAKDGGLVTDRSLRVAEALWAAGDIASPEGWPRIEHWRLAQQHGRIAALGMLGKPVSYDGVPFFWTEQHGTVLHYVGHATAWDEIVYDGAVEDFDFIAWYLRDDQVEAALIGGRDRASAILSHALRSRLSLPEARRLLSQQ